MKFAKVINAVSSATDHLDTDSLLSRVGLARRKSTFEHVMTIVGIFGAGMVVGAGVSMLASPVAPADARRKIGEGVRSVKNEINQGVRHARQELSERTHHAARALDDVARNGAIKTT
ncbi:hypothetical protein [Pendulispora albinea]|uniref:YtxH domain-containing protein n=1 Tax=Pendulispora albinea TaxID=2741071 RepID=A0ABZ2LT84_9BACT